MLWFMNSNVWDEGYFWLLWDIHFNITRGTTDSEINSVTWIKFGGHMAPLTLVTYLTTYLRI